MLDPEMLRKMLDYELVMVRMGLERQGRADVAASLPDEEDVVSGMARASEEDRDVWFFSGAPFFTSGPTGGLVTRPLSEGDLITLFEFTEANASLMGRDRPVFAAEAEVGTRTHACVLGPGFWEIGIGDLGLDRFGNERNIPVLACTEPFHSWRVRCMLVPLSPVEVEARNLHACRTLGGERAEGPRKRVESLGEFLIDL